MAASQPWSRSQARSLRVLLLPDRRSEEHTSELQSRPHLVCRLLLEKKIRKYGATTLALADIDGNGSLDLYVANYRAETVRTTGYMILRAGKQIVVRP